MPLSITIRLKTSPTDRTPAPGFHSYLPAMIRGLFDANYLGMVRVLRAALPLLRKQGSGLGITALPFIGFYRATKWAVEALHESLAQEVKAVGIKVTLV